MKIGDMVKLYFKSPRKLIRPLGVRGFFNWLPDKPYLKFVYWGETGKNLNLDKPLTYNEKLQWLKLYDRNPKYKMFVDKYEVRSYVKERIGERYLIPIVGLYNSVENIDWSNLPNQFVLKCTHGSNSNIICSDKEALHIKKAKGKLKRWMKRNWYWFGREWPYKNVKPRIICEKYLGDNIVDYKFMCFHGEPKIIQVHCGRYGNHTLDFYDTDWNRTEIRRNMNTSDCLIPKPILFDEMLTIAKKLSENEIHVRIDLYEVDGKVYFGEKTFYSASGFEQFAKDEYDQFLGSLIKLPT